MSDGPVTDSFNFPKDSKPWKYDAPFHRIDYPLYDAGPSPLDGHAYPCGCHSRDDAPKAAVLDALKRAIRTLPSWVPVCRDAKTGFPEIGHREVEGTLVRSFQTWTDVPMLAWHHYYDWNLHVLPSTGFEFCRSEANEPPSQEELRERNSEIPVIGHLFGSTQYQAVVKGKNVECEWDCGAFGNRPGPMFLENWLWPMAGERVWVMGRNIYDCGHPKGARDGDQKTGAHAGKMRSELHPCRAVATARWEAEAFPENGGSYVPAIKFMFFASRKGGYWNYEKLADSDFTFIVDLPKVTPPQAPFPISHTGKIPHNTIVIRPRLLKKIDYTPFQSSKATFLTAATADPIVELVMPFNPDAPQVKVKVPVTSVADSDCYGFILSLGWHDPDGSQAATVRKCTVTFEKVVTGGILHDVLTDEEWFMKMGVNGRWLFFRTKDDVVGREAEITMKNFKRTFYLAQRDGIRIAAHGAEINLVDNIFQRSDEDRTIRLDGVAIDYRRDVQGGNLDRHHRIFWEFLWKQANTLAQENEPLGLLDTAPMPASKDGEFAIADPVFFTKELGNTAELGYNERRVDYTLHYRVKIEPQ